MKAIVQDRYGTTAMLSLAEIETPSIADDEVLVRVHAAGVDPGVWHFMTGLPYLGRLGLGLTAPKVRVRGMDLSGIVEAVGSKVTTFKVGDAVYGSGNKGAFADFATAKEAALAKKPESLSFVQAAAIPTSACTAVHALRAGEVRPGQKVLIIGAAGGIGTFAVQLAKAIGAEVTAVCSTGKIELVRSLGADHVIDYTLDQPLPDRHFDVVLDIAGNRSMKVLRQTLTETGTLVFVGGEKGGRVLGGMERPLGAMLLAPFRKQKFRWFIAFTNTRDLLHLNEVHEAGKLSPVIERTFPLHEAAHAIDHLEAGKARGKLVLTV